MMQKPPSKQASSKHQARLPKSDEIKQQVLNFLQQGLTRDEISQKTGCSKSTIGRIKRSSIKQPEKSIEAKPIVPPVEARPIKPPMAADLELELPKEKEILNLLLDQKLSTNQISKRIGCPPYIVWRVKKKHGIGDNYKVHKKIIIDLNLNIKITELADDTLVEINYGGGEPLSEMEKEIKPMITGIVDNILRGRNVTSIERRDFQYRLIRFPGRFFFHKTKNQSDDALKS